MLIGLNIIISPQLGINYTTNIASCKDDSSTQASQYKQYESDWHFYKLRIKHALIMIKRNVSALMSGIWYKYDFICTFYNVMLCLYGSTWTQMRFFVMHVLTIAEADCVNEQRGYVEKNQKTISYVRRKPELFPMFIKCLEQGNHKHLANLLNAPSSKSSEITPS